MFKCNTDFNNHVRRSRAVFAGLLLVTLTAQAQEPSSPSAAVSSQTDYIAVLPGYVRPQDLTGSTNRGFTMAVLYGHPFNERFAVELNANGSIYEVGKDHGNDFYQQAISADVAFNLTTGRGRSFTPFLIAGVAPLHDDFYPNGRDGYGVAGSIGLGVVSMPLFSTGIRIRAEARYVRDSKEGGISEPRASLGIEIPLRRVERVVEYKEVKVVETREVIKEVAAPVPVDSDGDGVNDDRDRCPNTPHGVRVDAQGCAISNQVVILKDVNFEFNQSRLTPDAKSSLDKFAAAFNGQNGLRVEIGGHTDGVGSAAANLKLSQRRADSVRDYLISKGVPPDQLTARGFGQSRLLVSPEHTDEGRRTNRRVELRVLSAGGAGSAQ